MPALRPCIAAACFFAAGAACAQATPGVPLMKPSLQPKSAAPAAPAFQTITWEKLVPPNWDPFKELKGQDLSTLQDGDPRATELLKRMREIWDKAPVNPALVDQPVRIPGYVVPLEDTRDGIKEFLLVPYFGACVHSPPPPANQIIHVLPRSAVKNLRSMDAVWISGVLKNLSTDSYMGASSWRIEAVSVTPYGDAPR